MEPVVCYNNTFIPERDATISVRCGARWASLVATAVPEAQVLADED